MGVLVDRRQEFIGIVRRKEEGAVLLPLALGREERQDRKVGLAFRGDNLTLEDAGQDENLMAHALEDLDPLLSLERDAVHVANSPDDDPDVHAGQIPDGAGMFHEN